MDWVPGREDRRGYSRFPLNGRAQVEFEERRYFLTENVVEASAAGFFVETLQPATVGEAVSFDLRVTPDGPVCTGRGSVSWLRQENESDVGPAGFAVEFLRVDAQGGELLLELSEAFASGGEAAFLSRVEEAVEAWQNGGTEGEQRGEGLEDTETLLKETTEMAPIQEEIDTDPLIQTPENLGAETETSSPIDSDAEDTPAELGDDPADQLRAAESLSDPATAETPPRGILFEDRDVLSKTLDVGSSRSVAALRRRENPRKPVPIWPVLLTAGLLIGGLLWMTSPPPERPAVLSPVDAAEGVLVGDRSGELPSEPGLAAPAAASASESNGLDTTFRGIRDIRWRREGTGLRVVVEFSGALAEDGYEHFRPGNDPPREVLQVFGVLDEYSQDQLDVGEPELRSIRIGHHRSEDGVEDRVVLDLTSRAVRLRSVEPYASQLHLFLELPRQGETNGPT